MLQINSLSLTMRKELKIVINEKKLKEQTKMVIPRKKLRRITMTLTAWRKMKRGIYYGMGVVVEILVFLG